VIEKSYFASLAFFGAAAVLWATKSLFGATGVGPAESIAFVGFIVSFGTHSALRRKSDDHAHG
jgi:hypothetical protein